MAVGKNVIFSAAVGKVCPSQEEAKIKSGETIKPGYLVTKDSNGEFIAHDTAGVGGDWFVADLDSIGQGDATTALTVGDTVQAFIPVPGDFYNVVVATSQNITQKGLALTSNGDGTLKLATTGTATPDVTLFLADEVVNTGGTAQLVRVRVASSSANKASA